MKKNHATSHELTFVINIANISENCKNPCKGTARFFVIVLSLAICRDPPGGTPGSSDPISEPATPGNETYQKISEIGELFIK